MEDRLYSLLKHGYKIPSDQLESVYLRLRKAKIETPTQLKNALANINLYRSRKIKKLLHDLKIQPTTESLFKDQVTIKSRAPISLYARTLRKNTQRRHTSKSPHAQQVYKSPRRSSSVKDENISPVKTTSKYTRRRINLYSPLKKNTINKKPRQTISRSAHIPLSSLSPVGNELEPFKKSTKGQRSVQQQLDERSQQTIQRSLDKSHLFSRPIQADIENTPPLKTIPRSVNTSILLKRPSRRVDELVNKTSPRLLDKSIERPRKTKIFDVPAIRTRHRSMDKSIEIKRPILRVDEDLPTTKLNLSQKSPSPTYALRKEILYADENKL